MTDCIFCKVIDKTIPGYIVYEDDKTIAFLDIFPSTKGHTLVLLKRHGETILDYTPDDLGTLWAAVRKVTKGIQKAFQTTVLSIGINHGESAGVHHLHIHLLPRHQGDGGGIIQSLIKKEVKKEEMGAIQKKLQEKIGLTPDSRNQRNSDSGNQAPKECVSPKKIKT